MLNIRKKPRRHDENHPISDYSSVLRHHLDNLSDNPKNNYLREMVFSKFVGYETASREVRRQRAISKWLATERENEGTNVRLMTTPEDYHILPRVHYSEFMSFLRSVVSNIVGEVPPENVTSGSFSGGASTSRQRTESHPALKYAGRAHSTPLFHDQALELILDSEIWTDVIESLDVVRGNVLFTVPKSTDIDRCACKEPDINMYAQKGVGSFFRTRLKSVNIDLNDQSRNRRLAQLGSLEGRLATLDLSSASDSVSTELVFQAMPTLWFSLMNEIRSHETLIGYQGKESEWHTNEMFSSMGNGFTFELESLLFYSIARSVAYFRGVRGTISVYGDDIIVPVELAEDLMWVLSYLGFQVNTEKSSWSGPFRESCGGHYYDGFDITPFFVKEPQSRLMDIIHLANQIRKWSDDGVGVLNPELEPLWLELRDLVPRRYWGGYDLADKSRLCTYGYQGGHRLMSVTFKKALGACAYAYALDRGTKTPWSEPSSDIYDFSWYRNRSSLTSTSRVIKTRRFRRKKVRFESRWAGIPFLTEMECPSGESQ
jgi:hypothetical protein